MPLTSPTFTPDTAQCVVALQSIDRNINIYITLTAAQAAEWEDQDLTDRVSALTHAVQGFLSPGESTQLDVSWQRYARATITREYEVIEVPETAPAPDEPPTETPE